VSALGLCLVACTSSVRRGATLYADGRYIEAAEVFERNEYQLRSLSPQQQAEYGVYRGVTLHALGDTANARRWLAYAHDVERATPGSLSAGGRALLDRARAALDTARPASPVRPPTAIAATQPPSPPIAPSHGSAAERGPTRSFVGP
jgi:tetratricopeptide (TPR) repeat protein